MDQNNFRDHARDFLIDLVKDKTHTGGISQYNFYYGSGKYNDYKKADNSNAFKIFGFTTSESSTIATSNTSVNSEAKKKDEQATKLTKGESLFGFICQFSNGLQLLSKAKKDNGNKNEFPCLTIKIENNFGQKKESTTVNKSREDESCSFQQCVLFSYENIGLGNLGHYSIVFFQCSAIKYRANLISAEGKNTGGLSLENL